MKLLVLIIVILGVIKCQEDEVNAEQMVQYIRNRGTFLASMINMTERVSDEVKDAKRDALEAYKVLISINFGSKYALQMNDDEYNYYNNTQVELPIICNPNHNTQSDQDTKTLKGATKIDDNDFLKWDEVTSIVAGSKQLMSCWNEAGGTESDTLTLPNLDAVQVAKFYRCVTLHMDEKGIPENYIQAADGMNDPVALMTVLTWGDQGRTDLSWLEMWVYMCSKGRQPKESKYMAKEADAMTKFMQQKIRNRQRQAYARNTMELKKNLDKFTNLVQDIMSGKQESTYNNNKADDIVDKAMGRFKKHKKAKAIDEKTKKKLLKFLQGKIKNMKHVQKLIKRSDKILEREEEKFQEQQKKKESEQKRFKKHHKKHHKSERVKKMNKIEKMLEEYVEEYNKSHKSENDECIKKSRIGQIDKDLGAVFQNIRIKLQSKKVFGASARMKKVAKKETKKHYVHKIKRKQ